MFFYKNYRGFTDREGFRIFINNEMKDGESIGLNCGKYFITVSHKAITHCLRNLINSNSGVKEVLKLQIKVLLMMRIIL